MRYLDLSEDVGYRSRRFDDTISEIGCLLFLNYTYITFFFPVPEGYSSHHVCSFLCLSRKMGFACDQVYHVIRKFF